MKNFFHLGQNADRTDEQIADGAEQFDPSATLQEMGFAVPEEIEVKAAPDEPGDTDVGGRLHRETTEVPMDLSGFRTADHADEIQDDADKSVPEAINPKDLIGSKKPDLSLVPAAGILWESQAMMDGAAKYGPYNWRANPVLYRVYISAAMRHLQQLLDGEDFDPLSGVHHVGHARACLGVIADASETGNLKDDRPLPGPAGDMIRRFEEMKSFRR